MSQSLHGCDTSGIVVLRRKGGIFFVVPKSKRSRRSVAIPAVVQAALTAHRVRQLRERMVAGSRWVESGLVFTTRRGKPLDASNVTKAFHELLAKAGLPRIRIHDLRHTAATLLLARVSALGSSWRCLGTLKSASRWTPTATSCPPSNARRRSRWTRRWETEAASPFVCGTHSVGSNLEGAARSVVFRRRVCQLECQTAARGVAPTRTCRFC